MAELIADYSPLLEHSAGSRKLSIIREECPSLGYPPFDEVEAATGRKLLVESCTDHSCSAEIIGFEVYLS
ncbi:MAG: hypothetical protein ABS79_06230 [Planctomycetes bacterium SCN 63-9]|nr:MAG: hypothetical protein ABS79_06230 [Planctomycetes bacterium SCN 63-9]